MCGIVGAIQTGDAVSLRTQVRAAMCALAHRGPDGEGMSEFSVPVRPSGPDGATPATVLLGARRLAIIDLSAQASQPMSTRDGRFHIVFNGEIYNYRELRAELRQLGRCFQTESDTEVLLAGYEAWGSDILRRAIGMFSFALLDSHEATVFLARDPFGIKPLYYVRSSRAFIFCSEIAPLLDFPGVSRRVNARRLYEYVCSGISDYSDETLFADVSQLPAAHSLLVSCRDPGRAVPVCYWTVQRQTHQRSERDAAGRFRELFTDSVRLHLRSDVPVGVSLSGGIDSSAIVGVAHSLNGDGGALHSISYIADDPAVSEEKWSNIVARAACLEQHQVRISPEEFAQDFAELVRVQEQPFGSPTIYAQYRIFRAASEAGLKVMLGGHGADQYMGSYHPHLGVRFASLLRNGQWLEAVRFMRKASALPGSRGFLTWRSGVRHVLPESLVRQSVRQHMNSLPVNHEWFQSRGVSFESVLPAFRFENLHRLLAETLQKSNLPALLRIEDRNAMKFSVENRVPFLTVPLVDFVTSLPEEELIDGDGSCKSVLLRSMEGLVPREVLARRDKLGFFMPMNKLLRQAPQWASDILNDLPFVPALDAAGVSREAEAAFGTTQESRLVQPLIWRWMSLVAWAREFHVRFD